MVFGCSTAMAVILEVNLLRGAAQLKVVIWPMNVMFQAQKRTSGIHDRSLSEFRISFPRDHKGKAAKMVHTGMVGHLCTYIHTIIRLFRQKRVLDQEIVQTPHPLREEETNEKQSDDMPFETLH